jgi:hypothetical protein
MNVAEGLRCNPSNSVPLRGREAASVQDFSSTMAGATPVDVHEYESKAVPQRANDPHEFPFHGYYMAIGDRPW